MKVNSIIEKKSKQVKASEKKHKLNKPNLGHESPHPMQGRMVGESLIEVFFKYANNTNIQLTEQELQLIQEAPGDIRKFLAILTIMGGLGDGFGKMLDATSFKHSELGMELKAAADQGDEVAAYHYKNLDVYADVNDQRTIINLRIHYLDDSPRDDVKARLAKQANKDDDYKTIQQPDRQNRKNESKEIKRSNPVAKHSRNMNVSEYVEYWENRKSITSFIIDYLIDYPTDLLNDCKHFGEHMKTTLNIVDDLDEIERKNFITPSVFIHIS